MHSGMSCSDGEAWRRLPKEKARPGAQETLQTRAGRVSVATALRTQTQLRSHPVLPWWLSIPCQIESSLIDAIAEALSRPGNVPALSVRTRKR